MKFCSVPALLLVSIFATSMALPAGMTYYQPSFFYQAQTSPQRVMYLQYVQQPSSPGASSRLTNAAAAFVSGNTVATGTYLKDDVSEIAEESILDNTQADLEDTQYYGSLNTNIADTDEAAEADVPEVSEIPVKPELPEDDEVLEDKEAPIAETPVEADPEPAVAEIEDAVAEIEDAENDDDEYADEDSIVPSNARPQASPKASSNSAGAFFPIDFGGTDGGTIAVANSYSTGESGLAKSEAIAYGKSESTVRRH